MLPHPPWVLHSRGCTPFAISARGRAWERGGISRLKSLGASASGDNNGQQKAPGGNSPLLWLEPATGTGAGISPLAVVAEGAVGNPPPSSSSSSSSATALLLPQLRVLWVTARGAPTCPPSPLSTPKPSPAGAQQHHQHQRGFTRGKETLGDTQSLLVCPKKKEQPPARRERRGVCRVLSVRGGGRAAGCGRIVVAAHCVRAHCGGCAARRGCAGRQVSGTRGRTAQEARLGPARPGKS